MIGRNFSVKNAENSSEDNAKNSPKNSLPAVHIIEKSSKKRNVSLNYDQWRGNILFFL